MYNLKKIQECECNLLNIFIWVYVLLMCICGSFVKILYFCHFEAMELYVFILNFLTYVFAGVN